GNRNEVIKHFKNEMKEEVEQLAFERAEMTRKKIEHLEQYKARSVVVSNQLINADVFSLLRDGDQAYVSYLMVQNGTIVQTHTSQWEAHLDEPDEEILSFAIAQLRSTFNSLSAEIIVPFEIEYAELGVVITITK